MGAAIAGVLFGAFILYMWWCEMFSDSLFGQMARAMEDTFDLWKNLTPITEPAAAIAFIFGGFAGIIDELIGKNALYFSFIILALVFLIIAVLGIIPFPLPDWMYPANREAERRRKEAELNDDPPSVRSARAAKR